MKNDIIKLTSDLIKIISIKDNPKELIKIIDFSEDYFKNSPLVISKFIHNQKPSIIIAIKDTRHPKVFLNGHLDVVEAEKDQFIPKLQQDKLFGRGSGDMKGSVSVMMLIMKYFAKQEEKPNLSLMLTTDEEIGGHDGVEYLIKEKGYSADLVFIPDGGKNFDLIIEEKGVLHFILETKGKACHASRPWLGDNAIDKLVKALSILRKNFVNPENIEDWKISFNIGKIEGGEAPNKVADWTRAYCDIRYPNRYKQTEVFQKIEKLTGIKPKILTTGNTFFTSPNNPYLLKYKSVAEKILDRKIKITKHPAASDARFFSEHKIPVILTEPTSENHHGKNEWVSISSLEKMYFILKEYIEKICY